MFRIKKKLKKKIRKNEGKGRRGGRKKKKDRLYSCSHVASVQLMPAVVFGGIWCFPPPPPPFSSFFSFLKIILPLLMIFLII